MASRSFASSADSGSSSNNTRGRLTNARRQRNALTLAAGQLVGFAIAESIELHEPQGFFDTLLDLCLCNARHLESVGDIIEHSHVRKNGVGLKHHIYRTAVRIHAFHIHAIDGYRPFTGYFESGKHSQQGCLPTSRWTQQREELTLRDLERNVVDGSHDIAEAFADILYRYDGLTLGHGFSSLPCRSDFGSAATMPWR